ncbi:hypothetical protein [Halospina sp. K52047b]|jgi:hypothetical protein|uniref:hypothetical protein n=1 Tax=Halospina sp. K52047b TaxID=2614160 RepID=UPI00178859E8|nr:hypothetical protein [Halospina sp. K52047b]
MLKDAEEHEVIEIEEGINGYLFRSDARNTAYIADEQSERIEVNTGVASTDLLN